MIVTEELTIICLPLCLYLPVKMSATVDRIGIEYMRARLMRCHVFRLKTICMNTRTLVGLGMRGPGRVAGPALEIVSLAWCGKRSPSAIIRLRERKRGFRGLLRLIPVPCRPGPDDGPFWPFQCGALVVSLGREYAFFDKLVQFCEEAVGDFGSDDKLILLAAAGSIYLCHKLGNLPPPYRLQLGLGTS
ncbi:hypothetical protein F5Y08DRAFT_300129 [Xylaria arbuscula]|nr:hypothetical protein F5Y08DRAFT_300129 [Xylaria arbuscula]